MMSLLYFFWFIAKSYYLILAIQGPIAPDFPKAFDALAITPHEITFTNLIPFDQNGGHLQGIQKYGENRLFLSGSSQSKSFLVEVELDQFNKITRIIELMPEPFRHAGGFQVFDHYLAIGIEDNVKRTISKVMVYDLEQSENIWSQPMYAIQREGEYERVTAGAVGITSYRENMILAVANWDSRNIDLYFCPLKTFQMGKGEFKWKNSISSDLHWLSYQNINLFTDLKGGLYLVGLANNSEGQQVADLFQLVVDPSGIEKAALHKIQTKVFHTTDGVDFKAGAGISLGDSGEIHLVACPYQIEEITIINQFQ
ncbi:MAG: hypothetical protein WD398_09185 [Cyclobacteriaceae bacterium]